MAFNLARSRWRRRAAGRRAYARVGLREDRVAGREDVSPMVLAVRAAVATLPPRYRQVIVCRFLADLAVAETSVVMGCAERTVKSLTHKALVALRGAGLEEVVRDASSG